MNKNNSTSNGIGFTGDIIDKDYIGQFHGKEVYTVSDKELNRIILPESLVKYILKLQEDNEKYKKESLEAIFKNRF